MFQMLTVSDVDHLLVSGAARVLSRFLRVPRILLAGSYKQQKSRGGHEQNSIKNLKFVIGIMGDAVFKRCGINDDDLHRNYVALENEKLKFQILVFLVQIENLDAQLKLNCVLQTTLLEAEMKICIFAVTSLSSIFHSVNLGKKIRSDFLSSINCDSVIAKENEDYCVCSIKILIY